MATMTPRFVQCLVRGSWMSTCVPMHNVDNERGERWVCGVEVSGRRALSRAVAICCQVGAKLRRWAMTNDVSGRPNSCWAGLNPDLPGVLRHSNNPRWNWSLSSSPFLLVFLYKILHCLNGSFGMAVRLRKVGCRLNMVDLPSLAEFCKPMRCKLWATIGSQDRGHTNISKPATETVNDINRRDCTLILATHGQPVRRSLYIRYSQPWHENIPALVLSNGRVGKRSCRRSSLACDGWYVRHGWQSLMRSSNSRDMPGQWTTCRARDFVRTMPWWSACRSRRTCGRNVVGTTIRLPFETIPWPTDKWYRPPQYGWSYGVVSLCDAGNPSST